MKALISATVPTRLITGTVTQPLDVIVQNISGNNIYVSFDEVSSVTNNGLKIVPGASYANDKLTQPLYILSDVAGSEVRYEVQKRCKT